jgi:hypothetical protein
VVVSPDMIPDVVATAAQHSDAHLQVQLDEMTGQYQFVSLYCSGGLTPTDLQRFPWATCLAIADAAERSESEHVREVMEAQRSDQPLPKWRRRNAKRPGRRGHPDAHYRAVAKRYVELRRGGSTSPTTTIARERTVSRDTAAGWVRGARDRKYLPPARPGRAG